MTMVSPSVRRDRSTSLADSDVLRSPPGEERWAGGLNSRSAESCARRGVAGSGKPFGGSDLNSLDCLVPLHLLGGCDAEMTAPLQYPVRTVAQNPFRKP